MQVAPLNLILPFHYLDWATKDEQEEPTPRTHRHAQYFIGLCLTIIITALVRMTSPTVWVLPSLRDNSLSCFVCNALLCAWASAMVQTVSSWTSSSNKDFFSYQVKHERLGSAPKEPVTHWEQWLDERTNQGRLTATETLCGESHYCVNNRWSPPNPSADCCLRACQAGRHAASCNVVTRDYRARRDSNYDTSQLSSRPYNFFAMLTQR